MAGQLVLASRDVQDVEFAGFIGFANAMDVRQVASGADLRSAVYAAPESVVFWDAETFAAFAPVLKEVVPPSRVFAITSDALNLHPQVLQTGCFGHHLYRRFESPAPVLYARLAHAVLGLDRRGRARGALETSVTSRVFGLQGYFPEGAQLQSLTLKRSGHKRAAVEAIQNLFVKQKVNSRIAALAAQAADELMMNAIFDAPVLPSGAHLRKSTPRDLDFELVGPEVVDIQVASNGEYAGLCVTDHFGSLRKETLLRFLAQDFHNQAYDPARAAAQSGAGAGLGLHGIHQAGLSLLFASDPGERTEVMIFFSMLASYKDFRSGFRFLSVLTP